MHTKIAQSFTLSAAAKLLLFAILFIYNANVIAANNLKAIYLVSAKANKISSQLHKRIQTAYPNQQIARLNIGNTTFIENDNALYIAVGNQALDYLLRQQVRQPILSVFISRVAYTQVLSKYDAKEAGKPLSVIYADPSTDQQLALINVLFGKRSNTAVLLSEKTAFLDKSLLVAAEKIGISLNTVLHAEDKDIYRTLKAIDKENILLALPDSSIYNRETIRNIISASYRKGQFIIGYSKQFVDAGGLATVYYDIESITQTILSSINLFTNNKVLANEIAVNNFSVSINNYVAESYDLLLPSPDDARLAVKKALESCCEE